MSDFDKVNDTPDFIGKWQINTWGIRKYSIEETDGPGHAHVVLTGLSGPEAYELALEHNRKLLKELGK